MFTLNSTSICILGSAVLLSVSLCNCRKYACNSRPETLTRVINFKLKDKVTGNDILSFGGTVLPVPDSIKLKDIRTGVFYPLFVGQGADDVIIYSPQYTRPADVVDSLVFFYGNTLPDTLVVYIGLVDGWRGDECPYIKDAGINKVILRNQVLIETTHDGAVFSLSK